MVNCLLGTKIGTTQVFLPAGKPVGVTAIEAGPCVVTQVKTAEKEGYHAIQLGFGAAKRLSKAEKGHLKELGQFKHLREFRFEKPADIKTGEKIEVGVLKPGDLVDITGTSRGKGFAGGVKRYHFRGGPKTHGQSDRNRAPGSIGSTTTPGRVFKGLKMAGHLGNAQITSKRLEVIQVDPGRNVLLVKGAVPGGHGSLLMVTKVGAKKVPPPPAQKGKGKV